MPVFATPEPITVNLEPVVGNVRVIATDRVDTVVEVRPSDATNTSDVKAAEQTRVEYANGTLTVKAPKARPFDFSNKTRSIEVTVELPAGSRLHGNTGLGDLHATGRLGECRYKTGVGHLHLDRTGELHLNTATGNIHVADITGDADVTTSSGRVHLGALTGAGAVKNSNGETTLGVVTGPVRVKAANGDITIEETTDTVEARTANGSVKVRSAGRGAVTLETGLGDIEVGIRAGTAAWLDVNTRFGRVHNTMNTTDRPRDTTDTVEVHAHTSFGDITVHHS
jgi:DUF4097 and DUF4098 domain-containing protein YvlB